MTFMKLKYVLILGESTSPFLKSFSTLKNFFVFTQSGRILCIAVWWSEDDPFLKPIFKVFEAADAKYNFLKNISYHLPLNQT